MALVTKIMGAGMPAGAVNMILADVQDSLTATGTDQDTAQKIGAGIVRFTTVASGTGAILPAGAVGDEVMVINAGANALSVYPPVGHAINAGSTNAAISLPTACSIVIKRVSNLLWIARDSSQETFTQSGSGAVSRPVSGKLQETVSVLDFIPVASHAGIAAGSVTSDLTAYFVLAIATGKKVFCPKGTYYANVTQLSSNAWLFGEGEATVIRAFDTTASTLKCLSSGASSFITGVVVRDLKLYGTVEADGFHASPALIDFTGVKRCRIENVYFEGFRLDGIYLGGNVGASEYHNVDVTVRGCVFDGVNNGGRNGMSVIDVDGLDVDDCTFRNCAKSDQPGSLDFEPNQSFSVIKNVRVHHGRFYNTDGNRGHICLQTQDTANVENIIFDSNHLEDANTVSAIVLNMKTSAPATSLGIVISNNTAFITGGNFILKRDGCTDGTVISGNTARALRCVSFTNASGVQTDKNIIINGNNFFPENTGVGISLVETTSYVAIKSNTINGTPDTHITLGGNGDTDNVSIVDNDFIGTPVTRVITHGSVSSKNPLTNILRNNRFAVGHTHTFSASRTDYAGEDQNAYDFTNIPSDFAPGVHYSRVSSNNGPFSSDVGALHTYKMTNKANTDIYQEYVSQYSSVLLNKKFIRKAVNASTWDVWHRMYIGPDDVDTTAVGNVAGGEDDLQTYSLPANSLSWNGKTLRITAWGTGANNSNPKTLKFYFSSSIFSQALTVSQVNTWRLEVIVARTSSGNHDYTTRFFQDGTAQINNFANGTVAVSDAGAITIKCTGTVTDGGGGINNNDIVQEGMIVELLN